MNDRYCYADIEEMIMQLSYLNGESEGIAIDMIQAVSELIGFEGEAAEAVRARFSEQYTSIKTELIEVRQGIFQKLQTVLDAFLEIDNRTDVVICYSRLDENNRVITQHYNEIEDLMMEYHQALDEFDWCADISCPRCGGKLIYKKVSTSFSIECENKCGIKLSIRGI